MPSLLGHPGQAVEHACGGGGELAAVLQVGGHQGVGDQRQHVGVFGLGLVLAHVGQALLRAGLVAKAGIDQAPGDVGGDRQAVVAQAGPGALVHQAAVVLPRAIAGLLREQPVGGALDQGRVDIVDAAHVGELLQAVGGQHAVGGRVAEQREAAAAPPRRWSGAGSPG